MVFIRRHGRIEPWPPQSANPRWHVYLVDDCTASKFWSMGAPLADTILINRVPTWTPSSVRPPKKRERPMSRPPFDPDHPAPPPRADAPPPRRPPPPRPPDQLTLDTRPGTSRPCVVCGASFTASRIDARYCTGSCRTHAYRLRVSGGSA